MAKMRFKKDDRVLLDFTFKQKLAGTLYGFMHAGWWFWPPRMAYIRYYREEMVAWEVIDINGNIFLVVEERLRKLE